MVKKKTAKPAVAKRSSKTAEKAPPKKKAPAKAAVTKAGKKPAAVKKAATAKKAAPKQAAAKKPAAKPAAAKQVPAKPVPVKKSTVKKATVKKVATPKKTTAKTAPATAGLSADSTFEGFTPYQEKKGEAYMSEGQQAHFRHLLSAWKHELMEKVDETVHHMQDESGNIPDPNDRATQESDFTMELRTRDRERKLIKKIEESLTNLDNGDYGYCEVCGVEIGIRRLEARPTATLCIDCKTLAEIREKHLNR